MNLTPQPYGDFQKIVKNFYKKHFRLMPWRQTQDPYKIMISEIMLQQTQVDRVIPKFEHFVSKFPTVDDLAKATFQEVLACWQGLGYNRRALWLHQAAQQIVTQYGGNVPDTIDELTKLKGIGRNSAAAICVYAFNRPLPFIETNIRAVYIHHFFDDNDAVSDAEILPLVEQTIDVDNPREWYWALMDYGVHVKKEFKNPARKSKHYTKQSTFEGSRRQLRGKILKILLGQKMSSTHLENMFVADSERLPDILEELQKDGLIVRDGDMLYIS